MSRSRQSPLDFQQHYGFRNRQTKMFLLRKSDMCGICNKGFNSLKDTSIDHIIPISKGGRDTIDNMQVVHIECNRKKGNTESK